MFPCLNSIYIYSNLWDFFCFFKIENPGFMEVTEFVEVIRLVLQYLYIPFTNFERLQK